MKCIICYEHGVSKKFFIYPFSLGKASKHCPLSSWRKIVSLFFSGSLEGSYSSCFHFPLNSYLSKTKEKKKRKEAKIEGEIHFSVSCVLIRFRHFCCVWKYIYIYIYKPMLLGQSLTFPIVICAALLGCLFFVIFVPLYFRNFFLVWWGWYPYFHICLLRALVGNLNLLETFHLTRFLSSKWKFERSEDWSCNDCNVVIGF